MSSRDASGRTVLHFARGARMVDKLVSAGLCLDDKWNELNQTPLHQACVLGDFETMRHLLVRGADLNALCRCSWVGSRAVASLETTRHELKCARLLSIAEL